MVEESTSRNALANFIISSARSKPEVRVVASFRRVSATLTRELPAWLSIFSL